MKLYQKNLNLYVTRPLHPIYEEITKFPVFIQLSIYKEKNQRIEKHVKWHHGHSVSKIQIVGNSSGKMSHFIKRTDFEEKREMEEDPRVKELRYRCAWVV